LKGVNGISTLSVHGFEGLAQYLKEGEKHRFNSMESAIELAL
jgi:hypothetical protein